MTDRRPLLWLLAPLTLAAIYLVAPWPGPQALLHVALVLGLAPAFRSPLTAVLWACAAGWTFEAALHLYPRLGGTPLADMTLALLAWWLRAQWPPEGRTAFALRLGVLAVLHLLLVHLLVRLTAGAHAWGWSAAWTLVGVPLWAALAWPFQRIPLRR